MTAPTTTAAGQGADSIHEEVRLTQSPARVWRALTKPAELAEWFGVSIPGVTIAPGAHVRGFMSHKGYEHVPFDIIVEAMEPERRFSWRWHPHALDAGVDYSGEARTLVEFTLEATVEGGTLLRVTESGFSALPSSRRTIALVGNGKGWTGQLTKRLPAFLGA